MLRRNQEQRAKEFAQAQELSSRLMAVMGLKQPEAASDNFGSGKALQHVGNQAGHLPCNPDPIAAVTQSFGSSTSSTSGPTPKRTKKYQRFKPLTSHRTKAVFNATNGKATRDSTIKERRLPLLNLNDVAQNVRISTPSQPLRQKPDRIQENDEASKENRDMDCSDNLDDDSFDDSNMFTGTYRHSLNGRWNKVVPEALDDTTVEF